MSKAIILVAFGSTNIEGINNSIGLLERDFEVNFGREYTVLKAFTSKFIVNKLREKSGIYIPHIIDILFSLGNDGYTEVIIQPLHMMDGTELRELNNIIDEYRYSFEMLMIAKPLFEIEQEKIIEGNSTLVEGIYNETNKYSTVLLAGHGSKTTDSKPYLNLQAALNKDINKKFYLATLEGINKIEEVIKLLKADNITNLIIKPIFIIPGKHVLNDISGEENSWIAKLKECGIVAEVKKESILENYQIRKIYIDNIKSVIS